MFASVYSIEVFVARILPTMLLQVLDTVTPFARPAIQGEKDIYRY